jgi:hypothetical protein
VSEPVNEHTLEKSRFLRPAECGICGAYVPNHERHEQWHQRLKQQFESGLPEGVGIGGEKI